MGKQINSITFDYSYDNKILDSCITLEFNTERHYTDEYEVPYQVEILMSTGKGMNIPDVIEIKGLKELYDVIEKEDCLPDIGLLDYEEEELGLNIKDVTLRELYKEVLKRFYKSIC